jgi:hypothetical protein
MPNATQRTSRSLWKIMPQFGVKVHRDGWVVSTRTNRVLKPTTVTGGTVCISLPFNLGDDVIKSAGLCSLGRLVCYTFNGPPPADMEKPKAAHKNGDRTDNRAINLKWATSKEIGEELLLANKFATKMSLEDVKFAKWIYTYLNEGPVDMNALGATFNVSEQTMWLTLKHGVHWNNEYTAITRRMKVPPRVLDTYRRYREDNVLYAEELESVRKKIQATI